jgi:NAD(P)H-quinone oxidoreductase subunit K
MFSADSTTAVRGVDKLIPVDLYLPGCPPRPEAIFDAVIKLRKKVGDESLAERRKHQQTHRYFTVKHQMKRVSPAVTGSYLKADSQRAALEAAPGQKLSTDAAVLTPATELVES